MLENMKNKQKEWHTATKPFKKKFWQLECVGHSVAYVAHL
jgi:hypothetical protein